MPAKRSSEFEKIASIERILRGAASRDPKAAIKEAARQFEALFMQELMKSMRSGSLGEGWLDNAGTKMGTEMLDDQFAAKMTGMPGGLGGMPGQLPPGMKMPDLSMLKFPPSGDREQ